MSKPSGASFTRRAPDNITEELVAVLSSKASFEFKGLFDIIFLNLRERNAASGGEEMLRLRTYEKIQSLVGQGAVTRTGKGINQELQRCRGATASAKGGDESFARGMEPEGSGQSRSEVIATTFFHAQRSSF